MAANKSLERNLSYAGCACYAKAPQLRRLDHEGAIAVTLEERIVLLLVALAHDALDRALYAYVEDIANFLKALASGRWQQLPADEQLFSESSV